MNEMRYSALDIAAIVSLMELGCQEESHLIDRIWKGEKTLLLKPYRTNKRKFILDIYYWMNYFYEKPIIDQEFPAIQKDFECGKHDFDISQYVTDGMDLDLFFKNMRIRILYGKGNDYVRIKMRSLLSHYGYKRRSKVLLEHIHRCMKFYKLKATLRGGVECDIEHCSLDKMITFRVVKTRKK